MLDGVTRKQFLRIPETEMCLAEPEVTGSCGNSYIQNGIFKVALQRRRLYKRPHSDERSPFGIKYKTGDNCKLEECV